MFFGCHCVACQVALLLAVMADRIIRGISWRIKPCSFPLRGVRLPALAGVLLGYYLTLALGPHLPSVGDIKVRRGCGIRTPSTALHCAILKP